MNSWIIEWVWIAVMIWCGALFAAGGTHIEGPGGQKWLRRYLLPIGLAILAYFLGLVWWKCLVFLALSIASLSAGYGTNSPYWKKILVFTSYGLPSLVIGFSWWVVITPVLLTLGFMASNWKPLASTVFWKSWEFLAGVLVAFCYIGAMINQWK